MKATIRVGLEPTLKFQKAILSIEREIEYNSKEELERAIKGYQNIVHKMALESVKKIVKDIESENR